MKWVTRSYVQVDRVACPWLILRFVDNQADFLFGPAVSVIEAASPVPGLFPSMRRMSNWGITRGTVPSSRSFSSIN